MGVDQVSQHDHSANDEGGRSINPDAVSADENYVKSVYGRVHTVPEFATSGLGTVSEPWVDAVNPALDAAFDEWGALYFPPGHYKQTESVDLLRGLGVYYHESSGESQFAVAPLIGAGMKRSEIFLADGVDNHLIKGIQSLANDKRVDYFAIHNLMLNGNKDGNTSGSIIYGDQGSGAFSRLELINVSLRWAADQCIEISSAGSYQTWNSSKWYNVDAKYADSHGVEIPKDTRVSGLSNSSGNGGQGWVLRGIGAELDGVLAKFNGNRAVSMLSSEQSVRRVMAEDNQRDGSGAVIGTSLGVNDPVIENCAIRSPNGNEDFVFDLQSDDAHIRDVRNPDGVAWFDSKGTRTQWQGVLGGGPVGGVDLSSVNGQYPRQIAVADGTSSANAGDIAVWEESGTQWLVHQNEATV